MIEHEYTVLDYVKGGLFLLWFLGSIVAIFVVLIKFGPWLTISVFGQIFFVIGLMVLFSGIKKHNYKPSYLIFLYLGLAAIISGLFLQFGSDTLKEAPGKFLSYIGLSVFFFFGASIGSPCSLNSFMKFISLLFHLNLHMIVVRFIRIRQEIIHISRQKTHNARMDKFRSVIKIQLHLKGRIGCCCRCKRVPD